MGAVGDPPGKERLPLLDGFCGSLGGRGVELRDGGRWFKFWGGRDDFLNGLSHCGGDVVLSMLVREYTRHLDSPIFDGTLSIREQYDMTNFRREMLHSRRCEPFGRCSACRVRALR
jgi:hypothetical protein